jgi:hypothetical protein
MSIFETAMRATGSVLASRFPGYSFASGSIIRGGGGKGSDIDLVVVFDQLETAWRETFIEGDFPFDRRRAQLPRNSISLWPTLCCWDEEGGRTGQMDSPSAARDGSGTGR